MRFYQGEKIELLAPAGNLDILHDVVKTGCDAVYFGGPSLNMRMIRKGFNFSMEELKQGVALCHDHHKLAYITVNNLIDESELEEAKTYLAYLDTIGVDAIIVQDMAVLKLAQNLGVSYELHASVMMNVHNEAMVKALKEVGVTRVVVSREMSLDAIKALKKEVAIEIEYFTHGDMCIAHGSQCYYSSMLYGMSSNRGRCLKPCRWWFQEKELSEDPTSHKEPENPRDLKEPESPRDLKEPEDLSFPLAVKDLSLYPYLKEMAQAGVTSFKIEGRMRDKAFLCDLLNQYAKHLDEMIMDPDQYDPLSGYDHLVENRKRDLSAGYAFGKPGASNINKRYEGTGKFYSTGRMFSTPTKEEAIRDQKTLAIKDLLKPYATRHPLPLAISVKVNNYAQGIAALEGGAHRLYLAMEVFNPDQAWSLAELAGLAKRKGKTQLYMALPRMMNDRQVGQYYNYLSELKPWLDGLLVGSLGILEAYKPLGLKMVMDYSANVYNSQAAAFYKEKGAKTVTLSMELPVTSFAQTAMATDDYEMLVYGRLSAMYFEHDFYEVFGKKKDQILELENEAGTFEIRKDHQGRHHFLTTHTLNLIPFIPYFSRMNGSMFRIEAQTMEAREVFEIIKMIKRGSLDQAISDKASYLAFGKLEPQASPMGEGKKEA